LTRIRSTQKNMIAFFPKFLANRKGIFFLTFTLAAIFSFFLALEKFLHKLFQNLLSQKIVIALVGMGIFLDIFVFAFSSDLTKLVLIFLWIWSIRLYQFEGRVSLVGGLIFFILSSFLMTINKDIFAERVVTWAYVFFVIGVGEMFFQYQDEMRENRDESK